MSQMKLKLKSKPQSVRADVGRPGLTWADPGPADTAESEVYLVKQNTCRFLMEAESEFDR